MHLLDLDSTATLLTPNRRLAAVLLKKYNQSQRDKRLDAWPSLDILPINAWLERLFYTHLLNHRIPNPPLLLTTAQERILWEEILQQFPANESLLQLGYTAELAQSAWAILKQWNIPLTHPTLPLTEDSQHFLRWATCFSETCQEKKWLDINSLMDFIIYNIKHHALILPNTIQVIGFNELSPQQKNLFACCKYAGTRVSVIHTSSNGNASTNRISLPDTETEIYTMARWAKKRLNHSTHIGCVVPQLEAQRDPVFRIFSDVFFNEPLFNISAGKSLAAYPVIQAALHLLAFSHEMNKPVLFASLSQLLHSPFLGGAKQEYFKRAELEKNLRSKNFFKIPLEKFLHSCPILHHQIKKVFLLLDKKPDILTISEWVVFFTELLRAWGWPGERSLDSHEYQAVQRWMEWVQSYQSLDLILPRKSYLQALHYLKQVTQKNIFQPQSPDAPIHVLGLLEAAGLPFDDVWLMGLDDTVWPSPPKPNPFIPYVLQKNEKMPHSTAEREFLYSQSLMIQFQQNTKKMICSYPEKNKDSSLRPSPLIVGFSEMGVNELLLCDFLSPAERIFEQREWEEWEDSKAPPVSPGECIRGGATIFTYQSICPFKAFAKIRLQAYGLDPAPTHGLSLRERGKIVHKALEYLDESIEKAIKKAIIESIHPIHQDSMPCYIELEAIRLKKLLSEWIECEKKRPPFKIIAREQQRTVKIGTLEITLRIDRIDQLEDGTHCIIDYKTSKNNSIQDWLGDRPDAPQLPLYCITSDNSEFIRAIAFAELHAANLSFKGISQHFLNIDGIKFFPEWSMQWSHWKVVFEKLAMEFMNGHAIVDPKNRLATCLSCDLQSLCRIYE